MTDFVFLFALANEISFLAAKSKKKKNDSILKSTEEVLRGITKRGNRSFFRVYVVCARREERPECDEEHTRR